MFDELDPKRRRDEAASDDELEFERLEFLPEEESPANEMTAGEELTFDLTDTAVEPPVTVDPQETLPDASDFANVEGDPGTGTPFELLGSSLLDRFTSDDSLDWAFDLEDDDIDDLGG